MTFESRAFRDALGRFATGVTIITTRDAEGVPFGLTANSFNSVSLDPPLVLFSLARSSSAWDAFEQAVHFAVNVLRTGQEALSNRFARSSGEKFEGVALEPGEALAPVLAGALAVFECKVRDRFEGGDHVIYVGEVLRLRFDEQGAPLLYFAGKYRGLA